MSFIEQRTTTKQTDVLAGYLPNDDLHALKNKEGSNIRKVLIGLAAQWGRFRDTINEVYAEYDPNNTTALIEEWEELVGIPDDCLSNDGTLEERRVNILLKLSGINATTAKQFETIAAILGFTVTVQTGIDTATFPLTLPFILLDQDAAPFTIVVNLAEVSAPSGFPLTFPFVLSAEAPDVLLCFFEKIKPANTNLVFYYKPDVPVVPVFSPADLTGGVLWLNAAIQPSGAVATFPDQFATGNDATQGTGTAQPASGVDTINGLNGVTFDGTSDTLSLNKQLLVTGEDYSIFMVCKPTNITQVNSYLLSQYGSAVTNRTIFIANQSASHLEFFNSGSGGDLIGSETLVNGTPYIWQNSYDGTNVDFHVNGTQDATEARGVMTLGAADMEIGGNASFGRYWTGVIGEVIIYNRKLSTAETTQIMDYLSPKWGIAI